ncbi:hypothetical protein Pmani_025429 [Petrolisthes manimaculis]|uniref:Uncharacterized protein n=1 Tax=Petrolisthes manimaculis TaxID=1843537 RepID=A0AAE1P5J7_9EUCA|nr:hypothetical protein Pmani_025429 [Petrolisthes manimaculis]
MATHESKNEFKPVKILTTKQQKKSMRGASKAKKAGIKTALENPLALEWPTITPEHLDQITHLLTESCKGLGITITKPPWSEVRKHKPGKERKEFLRQYKENLLEAQQRDPDTLERDQAAADARTHLILGFNATMRALEADAIAGILVKSNASPPFVVKAFLPGCGNKCIPLVPITDMDTLLKANDSLALQHRCMVMGLRPTVTHTDNRFNALYVKMCEALIIEEGEEEEEKEGGEEEKEKKGGEEEKEKKGGEEEKEKKGGEEEEEKKGGEEDNGDDKENEVRQRQDKVTPNVQGKNDKENTPNIENKSEEITPRHLRKRVKERKILSAEEIQSFLLKRTHPNRRAFIPERQEGTNEETGWSRELGEKSEFGSEFISLAASEMKFDPKVPKFTYRVSNKGNPNVPKSTHTYSDKGNPNVPKSSHTDSDKGNPNVPKSTHTDSDKGNPNVPKSTHADSDKGNPNVPKSTHTDSDKGNPNVPKSTHRDSDKGNANVPKSTHRDSDKGNPNVPKSTHTDSDKGNPNVPKSTHTDSDKGNPNVPKSTQMNSSNRINEGDFDFCSMFVIDEEGDNEKDNDDGIMKRGNNDDNDGIIKKKGNNNERADDNEMKIYDVNLYEERNINLLYYKDEEEKKILQ